MQLGQILRLVPLKRCRLLQGNYPLSMSLSRAERVKVD